MHDRHGFARRVRLIGKRCACPTHGFATLSIQIQYGPGSSAATPTSRVARQRV
ncbi:hypothetical protein I553_8066 [Mycobacterium xenopi 4042]|uniref:Uncharacterized protein n=1 Tax=Mycobacterium xenopi 4042 TaxID=1299334 RepID=X8DBH6_MYCXE|nr:hypothetical protein I553_8066 [Mycobacterium xenopi 4042]